MIRITTSAKVMARMRPDGELLELLLDLGLAPEARGVDQDAAAVQSSPPGWRRG